MRMQYLDCTPHDTGDGKALLGTNYAYCRCLVLTIHYWECTPQHPDAGSAQLWLHLSYFWWGKCSEVGAHCCPVSCLPVFDCWNRSRNWLQTSQSAQPAAVLRGLQGYSRGRGGGLQRVQERAYRGLAPGLLPLSGVTRCMAGAGSRLHLVCSGLSCPDTTIIDN